METQDRFKKKIAANGQVTWYFQAFRTTRRGFKSKRAAQLEYLKMKKQQKERKKVRKNTIDSNPIFQEISDQWFEYYRSLNEQKRATYDKKKEILKTLNRWIGEKELEALDSDYLEELLFVLKERGIDGEAKGYAKNSLQALRQTLNLIFKYCVKKKILHKNPMEGVRFPKYQKTVEELKQSLYSVNQKYLTKDELQTVLNYAIVNEDLPMSTLFHVLFYTGCRIGEALAIQPQDIDFENNEILFFKQISKSSKAKDFTVETTKTVSSARRVVVTPFLMEKLKRLIHYLEEMKKTISFQIEEPYLFVYLGEGKQGIPFRRDYVNTHIKRCVARSGIDKPFHTHLTRHTMTSLCASYCSWDVLKERLGHTDKSTSEIYRHITSTEKVSPLNAFLSIENT
ncbi:TPA: tyrosine-type recombinase/integrase [Enterococcus faecalis]